jgi:hypothetical protein
VAGPRKLIGLLRPRAGIDLTSPLTITGIVGGLGTAGFSRGEEGWFGCFTLVAWRSGDGPVRSEPLRIEHRVADKKALEPFMARIRARQSIRIVLAADPEAFGDTARLKAEMRAFVGLAEDPEIAAAAAPILDPPPFHHPSQGAFEPDARLPDRFEGHASWLGRRIRLALAADGNDGSAQLAETALKLLADQLGWQDQIERAVYDELHPVWAENGWGDPGDEPTREQWLSRLTLRSIAVCEAGEFEFYFDDGDLFSGHCVIASGSLDEGVTHAQMAG